MGKESLQETRPLGGGASPAATAAGSGPGEREPYELISEMAGNWPISVRPWELGMRDSAQFGRPRQQRLSTAATRHVDVASLRSSLVWVECGFSLERGRRADDDRLRRPVREAASRRYLRKELELMLIQCERTSSTDTPGGIGAVGVLVPPWARSLSHPSLVSAMTLARSGVTGRSPFSLAPVAGRGTKPGRGQAAGWMDNHNYQMVRAMMRRARGRTSA
ncbi:hypothetical protein CSOJ01_01325 [Colletotrichum sojae]|uniref:Uncharacterized protein n=1 Tax=Colletotrichum sojae TaxID=2175907 RepID=A0A8H6JUF4_9PEZI|nr:hypothetical protein CSOJ01_01325 [Colletotrichum sojae]